MKFFKKLFSKIFHSSSEEPIAAIPIAIYEPPVYNDGEPPVYNYTRKERTEIRTIIGGYTDEINIAEIILDHVTKWNFCEYCTLGLKKDWKKLPCDHYIHKKCFNKLGSNCPKCNDSIYNGNDGPQRQIHRIEDIVPAPPVPVPSAPVPSAPPIPSAPVQRRLICDNQRRLICDNQAPPTFPDAPHLRLEGETHDEYRHRQQMGWLDEKGRERRKRAREKEEAERQRRQRRQRNQRNQKQQQNRRQNQRLARNFL